MKWLQFFLFFIFLSAFQSEVFGMNAPDTIATREGSIILNFIKHGSISLEYRGIVIYVDPVSRAADYSVMPKADIILITHEHQDHFDTSTIRLLSKKGTELVLNKSCFDIMKSGTALANSDNLKIKGILITAVPAYNITEGRDKFHPKGRDNGYVLTLGGKRIYIAGDTENIPEMKSLKNIDIAFLPMNQPYTMTPEQVAAAVESFMPKIVYPYHL